MNVPAIIFTVLTGVLLFRAPRQWAPLPLLAGATYMTMGQEIAIGSFHFTVTRMLIAVGFARIFLKRERIVGGIGLLDRLVILSAVWAVVAGLFHEGGVVVTRLGTAYDTLGTYFLIRVFIRGEAGIVHVFKMVICLLVPLAIALVVENATRENLFSIFGGVPAESIMRKGRVRAQGPFGNSILAGTVGALALPMAIYFWRTNRKLCLVGVAAAGSIVMASSSSGPIMTSAAVIGALGLWKFRAYLRMIRWTVVIAIVALDIVMSDPVYFLLARIDLAGGSTGYFRAALIDSAIRHMGEWWFAGTDYTRHWMPSGVPWSEKHTDIANHYIKMGVVGGLPMVVMFVTTLVVAFNSIGKALRRQRKSTVQRRFLMWTLGAILFGHAVTFISISYFDQTYVFLYLLLAAIGSIHAVAITSKVPSPSQKRPVESAGLGATSTP